MRTPYDSFRAMLRGFTGRKQKRVRKVVRRGRRGRKSRR